MKSLSHTAFATSAFLLSTAVFAQDAVTGPNQNSNPVERTDQGIFDTPFLWIALVVFALGLVLFFLRKGKTGTTARPHHRHQTGANFNDRSQRSR